MMCDGFYYRGGVCLYTDFKRTIIQASICLYHNIKITKLGSLIWVYICAINILDRDR
jgi:hypothetical protein